MNFPIKDISSDVGLALVVIYLIVKELVKKRDEGTVHGMLSSLNQLISAQVLTLEKILLKQDAIRDQIDRIKN